MGLPNLLDPYAPAKNTAQSLGNLGQDIGSFGDTMSRLSQVHPAVKLAVMHIMQGESPQDAAMRVRAHMMNPEAADQIWNGPPPSQHPAVLAAQGVPSAQGLDSAVQAVPQAQDAQGLSAAPQPAQPQPRSQPQAQPAPSALDQASGMSLNYRDLDAFSKVMPGIVADSRNAAALNRLDERLNSVEREGAANRGTRKAIEDERQTGQNERQQNLIAQRKQQMEVNHKDRMAAIAAQLSKAREARGTSRQVAEEALAVKMYDSAMGDLTRGVTSDVSLAATPELQDMIAKQQTDLNSLRPTIEAIKKRALAPPTNTSSSSSGAGPGVQKAAQQRLLEVLNGG